MTSGGEVDVIVWRWKQVLIGQKDGWKGIHMNSAATTDKTGWANKDTSHPAPKIARPNGQRGPEYDAVGATGAVWDGHI
jgi:hypothetical protein